MEIMMALHLCAMLALILVAAEVFTNALEHLGERLRISEGVTGSLFAAVGTAMPESMVPLLALFAGTDSVEVNQEIGVGAILGAPLMLSTLSLSLMGLSVARQRGLVGKLTPERRGISRDLNFFLLAFAIAATVLFLPKEPDCFLTLRASLAVALVVLYLIYVMLTLRVSDQLVRDGHGTQAHTEMFLCGIGLPDHMAVIVLQILLGLGLLIAGAEGFIHGIEAFSKVIGVSALLLSLLIIPIATELPEKVNSILWIRRHKDTLAFGNITGAMVFQGTILPAVGILLTPWDLRIEVLVGIAITLLATLWLRILLLAGYFRIWDLMVSGALYVAYLILMLGL